MKVFILAGGSGSRLWPLSRSLYPKQFIQLEAFDNLSFFQSTLHRAIQLVSFEDIYIITNESYKFHCLNQSKEIWIYLPEDHILIEPCAKNTLAAISYGLSHIDDHDVAVFFPSDHVIEDDALLFDMIDQCQDKACESLVLFGIKPSSPHSWYWYIGLENAWNWPFNVTEFKEKPDTDTAKHYIQKWYYRNSWIFMFNKEVFFAELKEHNLVYYDLFSLVEKDIHTFHNLPDLSVDYGLLEKSDNVFVWTLDLYWTDLWSFDAFDEYFKRVWIVNQQVLNLSGGDNFVLSDVDNKKISLIWLDDVIVVDTADALLISKKWQTQQVKEVVQMYKENGLTITDSWKKIYRPWWYYSLLDEEIWFKTLRLTILPWKWISSQVHFQRSEHWVVVWWKAKLTVGERESFLSSWDSSSVAKWQRHRLENCGDTALHIIETQMWNMLGEEEDIVRLKDVKLIALDMDGTLAQSKSPIDEPMASLLIKLLEKYSIAVISGGDYPQFEKQLIPSFAGVDQWLLSKLYLYPTSGTKFYTYIDWSFQKIYSDDLTEDEVRRSTACLLDATTRLGLIPSQQYGELIENRWTQITFSALWQQAPYELKKTWDPHFEKRKRVLEIVQPLLPDLSVGMWGATSIDITKKWIDKSYAIDRLKEELHLRVEDMIFVWDALMEGGNDFAVKKTGVRCIETSWPEETYDILRQFVF